MRACGCWPAACWRRARWPRRFASRLNSMKKKPEDLRSQRWFGPDTMRGFSHRSRMLQLGHRKEDFTGRPVIAVINTWSEINPCHAHLRERAEAVKRGVWEGGGLSCRNPRVFDH